MFVLFLYASIQARSILLNASKDSGKCIGFEINSTRQDKLVCAIRVQLMNADWLLWLLNQERSPDGLKSNFKEIGIDKLENF